MYPSRSHRLVHVINNREGPCTIQLVMTDTYTTQRRNGDCSTNTYSTLRTRFPVPRNIVKVASKFIPQTLVFSLCSLDRNVNDDDDTEPRL